MSKTGNNAIKQGQKIANSAFNAGIKAN